jgi:hypothetical protein
MGQARIAAAQCFGHIGMQGGEALDMQLIDHPPRGVQLHTPLWWRQVAHHAGLEGSGGVVPRVASQEVAGHMAYMDVITVVTPHNLARSWVQKQLGGVEALTLGRVPRTMHPPTIDQTSLSAR